MGSRKFNIGPLLAQSALIWAGLMLMVTSVFAHLYTLWIAGLVIVAVGVVGMWCYIQWGIKTEGETHGH
jgi:hypothetical protein